MEFFNENMQKGVVQIGSHLEYTMLRPYVGFLYQKWSCVS